MEPISFALAVGGIPGIFKSCIDCYQYIQFGREFETGLSLALSKLEATQIRLTRCGAAMGIQNSETALQLQEYDEEDDKTALPLATADREGFRVCD
jgi:hypothetical protein